MTGPYRIVAPLAVLLCMALAGCNGTIGALEPAMSVAKADAEDATDETPAGRTMIGKPYKVGGRWYHPKEDKDYDKAGMASWYGPKFHGRSTANGERFDQHALTAAHPTLPLPSYVRVTVENSGRSAVLRVNDRGPFKPGRIIDVSKAAAKELGFINAGHAKVRVEYLGPAEADGSDTETLVAAAKYNKNAKRITKARGTQVASADTAKPSRGFNPFSFGKKKDDDDDSAKRIEVKVAAARPTEPPKPLPGVQTRYLPRQQPTSEPISAPSATAFAETPESSGALDAVIAMNEAEAELPPAPKIEAQPLPEAAAENSGDRVLGAFDMFATVNATGVSTAVPSATDQP